MAMNVETPSLTARLDDLERRMRQLEWNQSPIKDIDVSLDSPRRAEVAR